MKKEKLNLQKHLIKILFLFGFFVFISLIIFVLSSSYEKNKSHRELIPLNDSQAEYYLGCDNKNNNFYLEFRKNDHSQNGNAYFIGSSNTPLEQFCDMKVEVKAHIKDGYGQMLCYGEKEKCVNRNEAMVIDIEEISKK